MQRSIVLAALATLALLVSPASADMGPLAQYLPDTGEDPPWTIRRDSDSFTLVNRDDTGALTYYYTDAAAGPGSSRTISVDVQMRSGGPDGGAKAGLLYGFDPRQRRYFLFVLQPGKNISLIRRDADGFTPMLEVRRSSLSDRSNRLTIEEGAEGIRLLVNGEQISAIDTDGVRMGGVGIAAAGLVEARFADFRVETSTPAPLLHTRTPSTSSRPASMSASASDVSRTRSSTPVRNAALRLRPLEIIDKTGPLAPMVAYTTMLPDGWKTDGGIVWNDADGCRRGPQLTWSATSPDLAWGVTVLPILSWSVSSIGQRLGCIEAEVPDAEAAARLYGRINPQANLRDITFKRSPEFEPFKQTLLQGVAQAPGFRHRADAVEMRGTFTGTDAKPHTMRMLVFTMHTELDYSVFGMGGGARYGSVALAIGVTTPTDFDAEEFPPEIVAVLQNLRSQPRWDAVVQNWWNEQNRIFAETNRRATADSSAALDRSMAAYRQRSASQEESQRRALGGLWETQRYADASGGTVDLDMHYRHAWRLDDGSIVQTNDALFSPSTLGETGTRLEPVN
ncbi:hypothetical protein ASA1KI_02280 [Opitutales bacterium ASA1]|uniref:hypothetical protein n=1 Tax=Congregicoccus parvus TaxID=3081749 RepID=UPI002B2C3BC0|nr:hypothetical protein ASA1KI_02280 [Opitutales bacterium ASA1]